MKEEKKKKKKKKEKQQLINQQKRIIKPPASQQTIQTAKETEQADEQGNKMHNHDNLQQQKPSLQISHKDTKQHLQKEEAYIHKTQLKKDCLNRNPVLQLSHHNDSAYDNQWIDSDKKDGNIKVHHTLSSMARTQCGSRYLQQKLQERDQQYYNMAFSELLHSLPKLIINLFGNYLCPPLFRYANTVDQRIQIISVLAPSFVLISINQQGTRALQKNYKIIENPKGTDFNYESYF